MTIDYEAERKRKQRERVRAYRQTETGRAKAVESTRKHRVKTKREVFDALGGRCTCCGEGEIAFLTIGHVNNDGGGRGRARTGYTLWMEVKRSGYDTERFTLLCFNCNTGAHINGGVCPHGKKVL